MQNKEEPELYNAVDELSTIEENEIEIIEADVTVNKDLMHILDVLVPEYKEQIKPIFHKNKLEPCLFFMKNWQLIYFRLPNVCYV